jgi:gas vesicle protein
MNSDQDRLVVSFASGIVLGAVIGAGVALLTSPQSGKRTRRTIRRRAKRVRGSASGRLDDLASDLKAKIDDAVSAAHERVG